jgi:hypothetical protein
MLGFSAVSTQPISSLPQDEVSVILINFSLPIEQSPFYSLDIGNKLCWIVCGDSEWTIVNCSESEWTLVSCSSESCD